MSTSFLVVIPARLASTRLPNKPLLDIAGKPMIVRVVEQAQKSKASKVVVATDHPDIVKVCQDHQIEVVLTREDHPSGTDRLAEVATQLRLPEETLVVNVQGDEPLIDPDLINELATLLAESSAPMATAAHTISEATDFFNPNVVKVVLNAASEALYFSRAPIPWARDAFIQNKEVLPETLSNTLALRHIGIYAYRAKFLHQYQDLSPSPIEQVEALEQLRVLWHGQKIAVAVVKHAPAAGVDTAEDLARVRAVFLN